MKGISVMDNENSSNEKIEIELRQLSKSFKEVVAVDNVNIRIRKGEFFSLLGPSGCGKTTTLRMIAGLETPTSGDIFLEGKNVTYVPAFNRDVNTVFQDYAIFPHMNVYENIYYPLRMKKIPRKNAHDKIINILKLVSMEGFEHRFSNQLSGGQRQRIALARALVNEPKALLLDEPLGALDFKLRVAMQGALKELQTELSMTFVYVTHDQTEAITMSDRIAVMNDGMTHQIGTPDEIYNNPNTAFVASFIGEMNFIKGVVSESRKDTLVVDVFGNKIQCGKNKYDFGNNDKVLVCIRPENVHVNPVKRMKNEIVTKLKRVVFRGNDFEVKTAVQDVDLSAVLDQKGWKRLDKVDADVKMGWDEEDTIVFPMDMTENMIHY
ncbi:MAG TPA: ABC transporter ATP-binding protein [Spirochaetes bacterium]|nr:ABC transporter ATP-binding protein [Spirochaetota bacterium]